MKIVDYSDRRTPPEKQTIEEMNKLSAIFRRRKQLASVYRARIIINEKELRG